MQTQGRSESADPTGDSALGGANLISVTVVSTWAYRGFDVSCLCTRKPLLVHSVRLTGGLNLCLQVVNPNTRVFPCRIVLELAMCLLLSLRVF